MTGIESLVRLPGTPLPVSLSTVVATWRVLAAAAVSPSTANPTMWYATRAAATCAYITLSLTVLLGIVRSVARVARVRKTWLLEETHRYVANATAAFVAVHLTTLLLDPLIPFSPLNLLLPADEPYRPFAVTVGILAMYSLLLVLVSSWLRRHISYDLWRSLHYVTFVAFWLVTLHGLLAGSDAGTSWMRLLYLGAALLVCAGMLTRLLWPPPEERQGASSAGAPMRRSW